MKSLRNPRVHWKIYRRTRKKLKFLANADVVLVAFAKSGRTWLSVMISHIAHQKFGSPANELVSSSRFRREQRSLPKFFFTADNFAPPSLSEETLLDLYKSRKVILLVRDPRDVAVSFYFHLSNRGSRVAKSVYGVSEDLRETSLFDFVSDERFGMPRVIDWLNRWERWIGEIPDGLVISYEDLQARTPQVLAEVMDFIGWDCSEDEIRTAVEFASFDRMRVLEHQEFFRSRSLKPRDRKDVNTYKVRRGKIGGYRDYFTPEQAAQLDAIVAQHLEPGVGYGMPEPPKLAARS